MTRLARAVPLAVMVAASVVSACKSKPAEAPAPVVMRPAVNQDSIDRANRAAMDQQRRRDSIANVERMAQAARDRARNDSIVAANSIRETMSAVRNNLVAEIHFDFDQATLSDQSRAILDQKVSALNANPNVRLKISGNADERGSDEYNMALGQRRAAAARKYLEEHGVASGRIDIVSFGEERGKCQAHEESCWAQNRRDEFEITAGGDNLRAGQ